MIKPRQTPVAFQGPLYFPPTPHRPHTLFNSAPVGTLHSLLRGSTLHLHRGDPFVVSEDAELDGQDGAEVAKIKMQEKGFNAARRRIEKDEPLEKRWAVELWQESERTEVVPLTPARRSGSLSRKRSTPVLSESTNSLSGKLASRIKRGKSVSGSAAILLEQEAHEEEQRTQELAYPMVFFASSERLADLWVEALSVALASDDSFVHVSSALSPSASLPVGLSSLALGGPSSSSMISSRRLPSAIPSPFPLPPSFNPGRRPSWLDRPPPSTANYRASPDASSTGRSRSSSDVPAWIAATLAAHEQAELAEATRRELPAIPTGRPEGALKARRSMSFLPSTTSPSMETSAAMERSQSDGRRSMESGRRILGLIGRRSSKKEVEPLNLDSYRMPSPTPCSRQTPRLNPYSSTTGSKSSASLADSLLSESHSTSNSSDRPSTPLDSPLPSYTTTPATPRPKSPFSAGHSTPKTLSDVLDQQPRRPVVSSRGMGSTARPSTAGADGRTTFGVGSRKEKTTSERQSKSHLKETSKESSASASSNSDVFVDAQASTSSREDSSGGGGRGLHIVNPAELILQMREESSQRRPLPRSTLPQGLSPSFSTTRLHHLSPPPAHPLGGLSPPPRSMSRQSLSSLASGRSPSKSSVHSVSLAERRKVVRKLSFGAVEEGQSRADH